jgi:hypothetical protein
MFTPPAEVSAVLAAFAPLFTEPSWLRAQALLCGVLLAPANHTLTAALRALGLAGEPGFQNYHRLLNRAFDCYILKPALQRAPSAGLRSF